MIFRYVNASIGICLLVSAVSGMNEWCFRPQFCTVKAILGRGQPVLMRWLLLWIMPLAQDRSIDLLVSCSTRYHCTADVSSLCRVEFSTMATLITSRCLYVLFCMLLPHNSQKRNTTKTDRTMRRVSPYSVPTFGQNIFTELVNQ